MRFILVSLIGSVLFAWALIAEAENQTAKEACASLDRPNIDCGCVAQRISVFERMSPSAQARATIVQGYLHGLGKPNTYLESYEALMSDQMSAMMAVEAYDKVGGQPSNITDYENGCVIADVSPIEIKSAYDFEAIGDYVAACTASTSDERFCQCDANRKARHVSAIEFEAYFRSFSDYDGDAFSSAELSQARGKAMGISGERFDQLQAAARTKMEATSDADTQYCTALTWADRKPGVSAEMRLDAGFEPGVVVITGARAPGQADGDIALRPTDDSGHGSRVGATAPNETTQTIATENGNRDFSLRPTDDSGHGSRLPDAGPAETALNIVNESCAAQGNSATYCTCYSQAYETDVAKKVDDPQVALAWALLNSGGAGLSTAEFMTMTQSIPQATHQAAGMMLIQTMELGSHCTQGQPLKAASLSGTPKQRMMEICVKENEDEALCSCTVGKMEAQFSPDDFELIVDIREAEFLGSEDALADVAEQRGLNRAEAEEALANNPAIIGGMMSMGASMMQCMGGMPNMSGLPGMPQQ